MFTYISTNSGVSVLSAYTYMLTIHYVYMHMDHTYISTTAGVSVSSVCVAVCCNAHIYIITTGKALDTDTPAVVDIYV